MHTSGSLKDSEPVSISSIWRLPRQLDVIDAIFERPGDGVVVIFRGINTSLCLFLLFTTIQLGQLAMQLIFCRLTTSNQNNIRI